MRIGVILKYIGVVLLMESAFMLLAAGVSLYNGMDSGFSPLMMSFMLTALLGAFPLMFVKHGGQLTSREGYTIVVGAWLASCLMGTFPYLMWGGEFSIVNAWFESVSGFTTTGSTILNDVEALPRSMLLWRSSTHWLGGVGVVVFALAVIPSLGKNKMTLSNMEITSLAKDNFQYRTQKIIKILLFVYLGMTVSEMVLLRVAGMGWFDAVNHAFSTVATGGFSTRNMSIGAFDNAWVEGIVTVFSFISGLHFGLIFATLIGSRNNLFRSDVTRYYFISTAVAAVIIALSLWDSGTYGSLGESLRHSIFQSVTIVTTTGFATADTNTWTPLAIVILMFLTYQCACAGSTSGGLRSDRVLLAFKVLRMRLRQQKHPNAVFRIRLNGVAQEESGIGFAMLYIVVFMLIVIAGAMVNAATGMDFLTSMSASATCLSNVGPGFGEVGSLDNFASIPEPAKMSSSVLMLLGRLEIFGLIQFFTLKWWK